MRVLGLRPELADPIGPIEVGKHQDVEQLGAGSGTEGIQNAPAAGAQADRGARGRTLAPAAGVP